jgi:hypothetical protein
MPATMPEHPTPSDTNNSNNVGLSSGGSIRATATTFMLKTSCTIYSNNNINNGSNNARGRWQTLKPGFTTATLLHSTKCGIHKLTSNLNTRFNEVCNATC